MSNSKYPYYPRESRESYRQKVGEEIYLAKEKDFLRQNYTDYIKSPQMVGFSEGWEEVPGSVIDEIEISTNCIRFDVIFKVRLCKLYYGDKKYSCTGIVTDQVRIGHLLNNHGFGSHAYADEGKTMELGMIKMAAKHNLMLCTKICTWPFTKALVQEAGDAHVRCHEIKIKEL